MQGLIVWLSGPHPAACNDLAIARDVDGILSELAPNEKVTADKAYSAHKNTITPLRLHPAKWSARRVAAVKKHNQAISSVHVIVENRNDNYARFGICKNTFRHSDPNGDGPNFDLLGRCWDIVTFLINRNILDTAGQTSAWSVPSRPLRSSPWAGMAPNVTQEQDDAAGPSGPRRERQQRQPLRDIGRTRDRFNPLGSM